jgi:hypothetical protein
MNDTSSAVAAAYTYDAAAGDYSVVVKLAQTLMIIPICLGQAFWQARRHCSSERAVAALKPALARDHADVTDQGRPAASDLYGTVSLRIGMAKSAPVPGSCIGRGDL